MRHIEHKITEEQLQALFQGKKLVFDFAGFPQITFYPPRYGVFITHEKRREMENAMYDKAFERMLEIMAELRKDE